MSPAKPRKLTPHQEAPPIDTATDRLRELADDPKLARLVAVNPSASAELQQRQGTREGAGAALPQGFDRWLKREALRSCRAQAIVHVENFGTGSTIRAPQALRRGQSSLDARLNTKLEQQARSHRSGR